MLKEDEKAGGGGVSDQPFIMFAVALWPNFLSNHQPCPNHPAHQRMGRSLHATVLGPVGI